MGRSTTVLVVDGANVVGARADGWWKDRAGAAARLHDRLLVADVPHERVVLVLEGGAKAGVRPGRDAHVTTVHAPKVGDDRIVEEARRAVEAGHRVTVCTADRILQGRVLHVGAETIGPSWLLDLL